MRVTGRVGDRERERDDEEQRENIIQLGRRRGREGERDGGRGRE